MNFLREIFKLSGTGFTHGQYYESMNMALKRLNNEYTMLHYPFYVNESDSFIRAQENLTDYCISLLGPLENKEILEIGCGNGVQTIYIYTRYHPLRITGIDINNANIVIANYEKSRADINNISFYVDDAQELTLIPSNSVDVMLNIESAFHYPDKSAFLKEVYRVLKPGGEFLIADILSDRIRWEKFMKVFGNQRAHHFWDQNRYNEGFLKSGLIIKYREDITQQVSNGWSMYRSWLPKIRREQLFRDLIFRLFYIINVRLNSYYLHSGQQYIIFVGYKPVSERLYH